MELCTQKHRIDRLETDVTDIKSKLNETAKKSDVQDLKEVERWNNKVTL